MSVPKVAKWPFFLADVILLAFAGWAMSGLTTPPGVTMVLVCAFAVGLAGILSVLPFLLEYRAAVRLMESEHLSDAVTQIQQVEELAGRIDRATSHWQTAHQLAEKTTVNAGEITERMSREIKAFTAFLEKSQDAEKSRMRLEIDKLRRGEGESLQIITALLDHVFAFQQAGARSGQPRLIEQLGHFQGACCDLARRIGLVPFIPEPNEPFNPEAHQPVDQQAEIPAGARVVQIVATGYTFQGQLLRRALVVLGVPGENEPETVTHSFAPVEAVIGAPVQEPAPVKPAPASEPAIMPPTDEEAYEVPTEPVMAPVAPPPLEPEPELEPELETSEAVMPPADEVADEVPTEPKSPEVSEPTLEAPEATDETLPSVSPEPVAASGEQPSAPANVETPAPENVETSAPANVPVEQEFPALATEKPVDEPEVRKPVRRPSKPRPPMEQELF